MDNKYDLLIDSYIENNIGIDANFINEALCKGLYQNIINLQQDDLMTNASIGNKNIKDANQKMRSDKIYWLDKKHDNEFEKEFLTHIDDFIERLNYTCYTNINSYEFHYAIYEEGSFYKRHKDQFQNNGDRKFSLIHYLNKDWHELDGGQLVVYQNNTSNTIQPEEQTAVFFKSDEMDHEVSITKRSRMSITGWLKSS
jgi:SM-20-related protein